MMSLQAEVSGRASSSKRRRGDSPSQRNDLTEGSPELQFSEDSNAKQVETDDANEVDRQPGADRNSRGPVGDDDGRGDEVVGGAAASRILSGHARHRGQGSRGRVAQEELTRSSTARLPPRCQLLLSHHRERYTGPKEKHFLGITPT